MESFIEGVRVQPCIWNPSHPDYREMHVKDEAWHRVVDHYGNSSIPNRKFWVRTRKEVVSPSIGMQYTYVSYKYVLNKCPPLPIFKLKRVQVAKTEWKKLRDNHRDALKRAKLGKNKLLPAQITTWKYAKAMQFLEPHMKYRITENIEMEPPTDTIASVKNSEHDVSTTDINLDMAGVSHTSKRRCIDRNNEFRQDTDALESFFHCILKSTKTMPPWMQTQVKKKIFAVIIDAEEYLSSQRQTVDTKVLLEKPILHETKIKTEVYTDDSCDNDY